MAVRDSYCLLMKVKEDKLVRGGNEKFSKKNIYIIMYSLVFIAFFVFFTKIEPIMVCDPDDWTYISYIRSPFPEWGAWNPTKIFPETFMGIIGGFAAYIICPIMGDYLYSLTYTYAFVVCIFIILYLVGFNMLLKSRVPNKQKTGVFEIVCFIAVQFLFFKTQIDSNVFMFSAINLNCFMNYLIPMWINAFLGFQVIANKGLKNMMRTDLYRKSVYISLIYLAVFSNMIVNVIFLAPAFYYFIIDMFEVIKKEKNDYGSIIKNNYMYLFVAGFELVCLIFEVNGGRAADIGFNKKNLLEFVYNIKAIVKMMDKQVLWISIVIILIAIVSVYKGKTEQDKKD